MKSIDTLRTSEEKKNYKLLKDVLQKSPLYPKTQYEIKRLEDELKIIHLLKDSRSFYYYYLISQELKRNSEPYMVCGTVNDLYVLYVLGVTHHNPIEYDCPYETSIGTINHPRGIRYVSFRVRMEYAETLREFIELYDDNYVSYDFPYESSQFVLVPKDMDVSDIFSSDKPDYESIKDNSLFQKLLWFDIVESKELSLINYMELKHGDVNFDDGIEAYKKVFFDERFQSDEDIEKYKGYNIDTLDDVIRLLSHSLSARENFDVYKTKYSNREEIFVYLYEQLGLSQDDSYLIMDNVRRGILTRKRYDSPIIDALPIDLLIDFKNTYYLNIKGHIVEMLYYYSKQAYYYVNYKDEYLDYCKYDENLEYDAYKGRYVAK